MTTVTELKGYNEVFEFADSINVRKPKTMKEELKNAVKFVEKFGRNAKGFSVVQAAYNHAGWMKTNEKIQQLLWAISNEIGNMAYDELEDDELTLWFKLTD